MLEFAERHQDSDESLSQYYEVLNDLAFQAYTDTPKELIKKYVDKKFVNGLHNITIREQMQLHDLDKTECNVLLVAGNYQSKLADTPIHIIVA